MMTQESAYRTNGGQKTEIIERTLNDGRVSIKIEARIDRTNHAQDHEAIRDALPQMVGELEDKLGVKHPLGAMPGSAVKITNGSVTVFGLVLEISQNRILLQTLVYGELETCSITNDGYAIITHGKGMEALVKARWREMSKDVWSSELDYVKSQDALMWIARNAACDWSKKQAIYRLTNLQALKEIVASRPSEWSDAIRNAAQNRIEALIKA